jgi:hypothetical protein
MFAAVPAKLLQFQALRGRFLVLRRRIVPILALGALERNNLSRHLPLLLAGWQQETGAVDRD